MRKKMSLSLFSLSLCTVVHCATAQGLTTQWIAEPAPAWNALFDRDSGWTGADGIYSFDTTGNDSVSANITYFVFGDTFVGGVQNNVRDSSTVLLNNTAAVMWGTNPDPRWIRFFQGPQGNGERRSLFIPKSPISTSDQWYWPNDGVIVDKTLYLFALRMLRTGSSVFDFGVDGLNLIELPLGFGNPLRYESQHDVPFYSPSNEQRGDQYIGHAVMANTFQARAPFPDEYVYIYGPRNNGLIKELLVARVRPHDIKNFNAYRFWNGQTWSDNFELAVAVTDRISSEFSMTPLVDGRFLLVFQRDAISDSVAYRVCDTPAGPCGDLVDIYTCPEASEGLLCYNAKAHPHLSRKDALLISYNVNTGIGADPFQHYSDADIYRPRFIWLNLNAIQ